MTVTCPKCKTPLTDGMFRKDMFGMKCERCYLEWSHDMINRYRNEFHEGDREPLK